MRKYLKIALLVCALTLLLCIGVLAADGGTVTAAGFYNIGTESGVTVTPVASSGTVTQCSANVDGQTGYETFYAGADKLTVTMSGVPAGEYLVILVKGDGLPTAADPICYINQTAPSSGTVSFDVYPNLTGVSGKMTLYITSSAQGFTMKTVTLGYAQSGTDEKAPYVLGDVNDDGSIDPQDALAVLRHFAKLESLEGGKLMAANVHKDAAENQIDPQDALDILRYFAKLISSFE